MDSQVTKSVVKLKTQKEYYYSMRAFKLIHIPRFLRVFHLLTTVGEETAVLEFCNSGLKFVVSSHHFRVILHIRPPFLHHYQHPNFLNYLRIELRQFCDHLRQRIWSSFAMDFNLSDHQQPPLAFLTFHDDSGAHFSYTVRLLNTNGHVGNFGDVITTTKSVSVVSEKFRRIVMEYMNVDKVDVVLTNSQFIFLSAFKRVTLNAEANGCIIHGVNAGERIEYSITLRPTSLFSGLASLVERVWFYLETVPKTSIAISAPIGFESQFVIIFQN